MKYTGTIAAFLVHSTMCIGQSTFSLVHTAPNTTASDGRSVFETDNGYLLFSAQYDPVYARTWFYATTLDQEGVVLETKQYRSTRHLDAGLVDCIAENPNGTFTAAISHFTSGEPDSLFLYHFDENGDTLSRHFVLSEQYVVVRDCQRTADGNYLIVGQGTDPAGPPNSPACLRKVTPTGEVLLTRFWPAYLTFYTINPMEDGYYLIGGERYTPQNVDETVLLKVNAEGEEQWVRFIGAHSSYGGGAGHSVLLANGNYLVPGTWLPADSAGIDEYGYASLYTFSPTGSQLEREDLLYGRFGGAVLSRRTADDGLFIVGGKYQVPRDPDLAATIWRTDPVGDTLYSRKYWYYGGYGAWNAASYGMDLTSDGGAIFTGLARQGQVGEFPYRRYTWVLKLDEYGCLTPGCQNVGVQDYELALQSALVLAPNPVSDQLNITLPLPAGYTLHGAVQAEVLDVQGKEVLRQSVNNSTTELRSSLDVRALPSGLYYLHLRDAQKWLAGGKVVVE